MIEKTEESVEAREKALDELIAYMLGMNNAPNESVKRELQRVLEKMEG